MTLDEIQLDDLVMVEKISGDFAIKRRLLDLGFIPGAYVKCVLISTFKDPKAYQVSGNIIALRKSDARNIGVNYEAN